MFIKTQANNDLNFDILFIFSLNIDLQNNILGQYPLQQCYFQYAKKDY